MAKPVEEVAQDIQDTMRTNGVDVITFSWPEFYRVSGREKLKDVFLEDLKKRLGTRNLLACYGQAIVLVAKDFAFAPSKNA